VMAKKLAVLLETGDKGTGAEFHGPWSFYFDDILLMKKDIKIYQTLATFTKIWSQEHFAGASKEWLALEFKHH
jgi:hypothetical protein